MAESAEDDGEEGAVRAVDGSRKGTRLRRAALAHLERYAASEGDLRRVLTRRLDRWARLDAAEAERAEGRASDRRNAEERAEAARLVDGVVAHCAALGLVDDRAFAGTKVAVAGRKGHSRRRTAATLAARGVDAEVAAAAITDGGSDELVLAAVFARRRRLGPFRLRPAADPVAADRRDLAALCRAGHPPSLARRVLALDRAAAEALAAGEGGETEV
ncbi:hypothetical protein GCM10007904_34260 [Oharaeibacter diazotrophicus]|nr:hypothetical protein GCM10007904_34260 [Oharaeibacter diazotrophicus]